MCNLYKAYLTATKFEYQCGKKERSSLIHALKEMMLALKRLNYWRAEWKSLEKLALNFAGWLWKFSSLRSGFVKLFQLRKVFKFINFFFKKADQSSQKKIQIIWKLPLALPVLPLHS